MKKIACIRFLSLIIAVAALSAATPAQTSTSTLPNLPESDAVAYINLRRILNDALPRVLPEKQLADMKAGIDKIKQKAGFDLYGIDNAVMAMRVGKVTAGSPVPEFILAVRGSFNADALVSLMRIALQGKYQEEKYGSKTLTTLKISDLLKSDDGKPTSPLPIPVSEISVTALDAGTLAFGYPNYLKAGIDAQGGQGGIKPELAALVMRDTNALFSIAGLIPPGLLSSLVPKEAQGNEEINKLVSGIDQVYLSLGLDAADFTLLLTIRTATADQANTLSGLAQMGAQALVGGTKDKNIKGLLEALKVTTQGNETQLQTRIPQTVVGDLVRSMMQPPAVKDEASSTAQTPSKAATKKPPQRRATGKRPVKKP
jgi:hypothetical protein